MKLISLNVWGGQLRDELAEFMTKHADDTDIFCLQEIFDNAVHYRKVLGLIDIDTFNTIKNLLPNHIGYYAPSQHDDEGLALFIKPDIQITNIGDEFAFRYLNAMKNDDGRTIGRNLQYVIFNKDGQDYTVVNFHGLWNGNGKTDTGDRINQSRKVRDFIDNRAVGKTVLVGDFNLNPDTESMAILEKDMRNLISEHGVTSTRSHHYTKEGKFADYAIVSNDVTVVGFNVLQDPVSDHLPLFLEFV